MTRDQFVRRLAFDRGYRGDTFATADELRTPGYDAEYRRGQEAARIERAPLQPSPLESSADASGEWDVDARMAEAYGGGR